MLWLQFRAGTGFCRLLTILRYISRCDGSTVMRTSPLRVLILRAHLLEMIISVFFVGLALFLWWGRSYSDVSLFAGAALLVAGAMVFLLR